MTVLFRYLRRAAIWLLLLRGYAALGAAPPLPTDTLLARLKRPGLPDTLRAQYLSNLCLNHWTSDLRASRRYGEQSVALARRIGYARGEVKALNNLGAACLYSSDFKAAERYYEVGLGLSQRLGLRAMEGHLSMGLGNVARLLSDYPRAARFYEQTRQIYFACRPRNVQWEANILSNLAAVYQELKQYDKASQVLRQTLALGPSVSADFMAQALGSLGKLQLAQQHPDSARATAQRGLQLAVAADVPVIEGYLRQVLADAALALKQPAEAQVQAQLSVRLAKKADDPYREGEGLYSLAEALHALHRPEAFDTLKSYITLNDTIMAQDRTDAIAEAQTRFDLAGEQARTRLAAQRLQIANQRRELDRLRYRQQMAGLGAGLAALTGLLLVSGWFYRRLQRSRAALAIAAAKLETLNRTKDRLFAIVAHDLRNPLSALTGIQALIQRYVRRGEPERLVELGDHLQQTAQTLYGVLDNVLGWAVSQSGELEARPEAVSVAALVREAADIGRLQATASDIAFTVETGPDPDLVTDRQMVRTILRNVLGNALKFTPAEGRVTFTAGTETAPDRTGVTFRIADSGPGFSAAAAAAWEAAAPGPRTSDASGRSGVGLGLVVCRAFATQLGGTLTWRNRPEGGAEVQLWLPLAG